LKLLITGHLPIRTYQPHQDADNFCSRATLPAY